MSEIKAAMFQGATPSQRERIKLIAATNYPGEWVAYDYDSYDVCGDSDCNCRQRNIVGHGKTEEEAIADFWEQWEERNG